MSVLSVSWDGIIFSPFRSHQAPWRRWGKKK